MIRFWALLIIFLLKYGLAILVRAGSRVGWGWVCNTLPFHPHTLILDLDFSK